MLKTLKNGEVAVLMQPVTTVNGFVIPEGTSIRGVKILTVTAMFDILPEIYCPYTDFLLYRRVLVRADNMYAKVNKLS